MGHSLSFHLLQFSPGLDLMAAGVERGPKMKLTLAYLFELWQKAYSCFHFSAFSKMKFLFSSTCRVALR
ncbi:hypothetical protein Y032_0089g2245 [Ancylostoma ceylanicum]|uniref:Uncharacterized protein n=1 Tax=Ancylostoma ceylanicum TaxID=53326 RepID=A0A016TNW4_9BILA|nr:hypothetical protein Y032_0089g2245 [Ancylostoma ceylanicum]